MRRRWPSSTKCTEGVGRSDIGAITSNQRNRASAAAISWLSENARFCSLFHAASASI